MEPPETWWSPVFGVMVRRHDVLVDMNGAPVARLPRDAVQLVPAESVDEKGRGPSYRRGFADGQMAERAQVGRCGASFPAFAGEAPPICELSAGHDGWHRQGTAEWGVPPKVASGDAPPFAPELADAPLVTGESGAPAPLVVDQPVHESTLPAEIERGMSEQHAHVRDVSEPRPGMVAAEFDSGPLHEAELYVKLVDGDLPTVVVTDAGDFWVAYTLTSPSPGGSLWRYRYAGDATDAERRQCVYVDDNDRAEGDDQS